MSHRHRRDSLIRRGRARSKRLIPDVLRYLLNTLSLLLVRCSAISMICYLLVALHPSRFATSRIVLPSRLRRSTTMSLVRSYPESLTDLMILANAAVDNSQPVAVLADAAPSDASLTNQSSNDECMSSISDSSVSSVLRKSHNPKSFYDTINPSTAHCAFISTHNRTQHKPHYKNREKQILHHSTCLRHLLRLLPIAIMLLLNSVH